MFKLYFLKSVLFKHWTETECVMGRQFQTQYISLRGEQQKHWKVFQKTEYSDPPKKLNGRIFGDQKNFALKLFQLLYV